MTIKERIQLAQLGYTKAEVQAMVEEERAAAEAAANAPEPEQQEEAPEQAPAAAPSVTAQDLLAAIHDLKDAIHSQNIQNSRQPEQAVETMDSVLSAILNPKKED